MLDELWLNGLFLDTDGNGGGGGGGNGDGNGDGDGDGGKSKSKGDGEGEENGDVLEWDAWHGEQSDEIRELIKVHETGLKSALTSERDARKDLEGKVRGFAKEAKDGSKLQDELKGLADDLKAADRKADFYGDAHKAGITNLKMAYLIAVSDDLFDRRGNANFGKMKEEYPELFAGKKKVDGNIADGTGGRIGGGKKDMNAAIRAAAGKG